MSNAAEMDAQEIINYIATAPKKTPVKLYVREKPGMKVAWGDAHVYGGRRGKTVFGDWDELKAILDANADSIDYYDVENDCRNSAVPMLDLKGINARIEPGAIIRDRVEIGDRAVIMMGAIINIVLDPILIFGYFGAPALGIAGAAGATVFGQIIAFGLGFYLNKTKNHEITISLRSFKPNGEIIRHIYAVGVPSIIMASIGSIMTFGINKILIAFSSTATAVFGVYFKLQSFVFMPVFGLNNGTVPIIAYNYGAGKPDRIMGTIKLAAVYATTIMLCGFAVFQLMPDKLLMIFSASDTMLSIGIPALRIISISFLFAGCSIVCTSLFQALGHGMLSLWISVFRQLVVLLPVAFIFARIGGLHTVWFAFPIAEAFAIIFSGVCLVHVYRKEIIPLKAQQGK